MHITRRTYALRDTHEKHNRFLPDKINILLLLPEKCIEKSSFIHPEEEEEEEKKRRKNDMENYKLQDNTH